MENQKEIPNKEEESKENNEEEKRLSPDVDPIRVMLVGLNNYTNDKQIVKFFANTFDPNEIEVVSAYKQLNQNYAVVTFKNETQKFAFLKKIEENTYMLRKKKLKAKEATIDRMILRKEKKVCKILKEPVQNFQITEEEIEEIKKQSIQDKVCPLWKTEYKDQIKQKSEELTKILSKITQTAKRQLSYNDRAPNWIKNAEDGPCCKLEKFIECDENNLFYYRNKSEMTIGYNTNNEISVGYNKGRLDKGLVFVERNALCPLSSKESIQISELLEEIINKFKDSYTIEPYQKFKATGFWRYLVVRQSDKTKEMIIEIVVNSESIPQVQLDEIKTTLITQFTSLKLQNSMQLKCLGMLHYNGRSDAIPFDISPEILIGESCTYSEIILEKKFKVSINSFLQVNTPQCEKLYSVIKEEAEIDQDTVLLDLYSGIGTIGICIGDSAKKIISIEVIPAACIDADLNSKQNNLQNFECISAKVEEELQNILKKESLQNQNKLKFVAIVDPPRSGLVANVAKSLRTCKGLDKLIYVSCNPAGINENILTLCLPENKKHKAPPFTPVKAIGVDLFPQTNHFECVLVLERLYD